MRKIVVIRTDGDNEMGLGHIYRSLYLANELRTHGFTIHFVTSNKFKSVLGKSGKCHVVTNLTREIRLIKKIHPEIFILDILKNFFPYSKSYFLKVKKLCKKMIAIDYVSQDLQYFDLSFHSLFGPKRFSATKTYHNLKYAIVSKRFKQASKSFQLKKHVSSLLVVSGGSDTQCISPKILNALNGLKTPINVTLIAGPKFQCWDLLNKEKINFKHKLRILHNVQNMMREMKKHQLAITAAGVTMTELLTIGVPSVIVYGAAHEKEAADLVHKNNLALSVGYGKTISTNKIVKSVNYLINNFNKRKQFNKNSKRIFDAQGTKRLVNNILS